jgi:hypothetical protein
MNNEIEQKIALEIAHIFLRMKKLHIPIDVKEIRNHLHKIYKCLSPPWDADDCDIKGILNLQCKIWKHTAEIEMILDEVDMPSKTKKQEEIK